MATPINERNLILLAGLIQFVNILDFMMVMPLGPDFAAALGIPTNDIGLIGGIYTFAAAVSGLISAFFLDRFSRKKALLFCLSGLIIATFAGALVWDKASMLTARFIAGLFGGPLTSLVQALIADYVPPERRGRAMGKVAGAFAAASVLGVPFGLELSSRFSWHAPFIVTSIAGLGIMLLAFYKLPYHAPFAKAERLRKRFLNLLHIAKSKRARMSYLFMSLLMLSGFMIIPNIAAHLQLNLHYPREKLGLLYFFGGAVSFFSMRFAGWLVDHTSAFRSMLVFTILVTIVLSAGFIWFSPAAPIVLVFVCLMVSLSGRTVSAQTLSSKIPSPSERGMFMSLQSAVMHMSSALGAYYSSLVLTEVNGKLLHMPLVGATSLILSLMIPFLIWRTERHLKASVTLPVIPAPGT